MTRNQSNDKQSDDRDGSARDAMEDGSAIRTTIEQGTTIEKTLRPLAWSRANQAGRRQAAALAAVIRVHQAPWMVGVVVRRMVARGYDGQAAGFCHGIGVELLG